MKPVVVGLILLGAATSLVAVAISSSVEVLRIDDLRTAYAGGKIQVDGGKVLEIASYNPLAFTVCPDGNPDAAIQVVSKRTPPENLKPGIDVSLRGEYDPSTNTLDAYRISTKCPSKYEASKGDGEAPSGAGYTPAAATQTPRPAGVN